MKIASWNVNSVKVRLPHLLDYLKSAQPDVLCLQEIKCLADDFPQLELQGLGYRVEALGQRAYNGVALVSKQPARDIVVGLPEAGDDDQARYIEASFAGAAGDEVRVASLYLPNGNPIGTDKFAYKLGWMERLHAHTQALLRREIPFVLAGDYNVCPRDEDVYDPVAMRDDALVQPESRARYRALLYLGLTDTGLEARTDLSDYRIIHFATHGVVTSRAAKCAAQPALLTSFGGNGSDGLLTFREIFDLHLDADLVILSACDTAGKASAAATEQAGLATGGDVALDGLVRAFVGAGGRLVIASHWPVPDDFNATQRLVTGLFSAPPGTPTVTALRMSQRQLMDDVNTSHPFYWAAFAAIGDGEVPVIRPLGPQIAAAGK